MSYIVPLKLLAKKILGLSRWHFTKSTSEIMQILDYWIALRYLCGISNTNPLPSLVIPVPPRATSHDASAAAQHRQLAEGVNSTNEPPHPNRVGLLPLPLPFPPPTSLLQPNSASVPAPPSSQPVVRSATISRHLLTTRSSLPPSLTQALRAPPSQRLERHIRRLVACPCPPPTARLPPPTAIPLNLLIPPLPPFPHPFSHPHLYPGP